MAPSEFRPPRNADLLLRNHADQNLTPTAARHIVLPKEQIKIANWDQTYEKS
jgi:hypothetical protein